VQHKYHRAHIGKNPEICARTGKYRRRRRRKEEEEEEQQKKKDV
jgi:hypothetical protein